MKEIKKEVLEHVESIYKKHIPAESEQIAKKIIELQKKSAGAVKVRSIQSIRNMLEKGEVFYVKNKHNEIIFSFYFEPFNSSKLSDTYIIGGLTSIDAKMGIKYHRKWFENIGNFRTKILLARTSPRIASVFLIPVGMREINSNEFKIDFKKDYIKYMKKDNPNYELNETEKLYIYDPKTTTPTKV